MRKRRMSAKSLILAATTIMLLGMGTARATTYYISQSSGNDNWTGKAPDLKHQATQMNRSPNSPTKRVANPSPKDATSSAKPEATQRATIPATRLTRATTQIR